MKSARLQAALARRREAEHIKVEKSAAVERYYDQWGRITSRFESWTTPQYYKDAEDNYAKIQEEKKKEESLKSRRSSLKSKLDEENERFQKELQDIRRPKAKSLSSEILQGVRNRIVETEEGKRRLDLESQLYSKWRYGNDRDAIILESKTPSQAMAKLSWLDKQVEMQIQSEKDKKECHERELILHAEARKHEEYVLERNKMRETEIKELRSLQENNVYELKSRERESNDLKMLEVRMTTKKDEIIKEIEQLRVYNDRRRDRVVALHNLRRIKMLLRDRSEAIRRDLSHDLQLLERISIDCFDTDDSINYLKKKFQLQYDLELEKQTNIEAMYESEAKHCLAKQEEKWNEEALVREQQLKCLLEDRLNDIEIKIMECVQRQRDMINIRENHVKAIENSNHRLKSLMQDKSNESFLPAPIVNRSPIVDELISRPISSRSSTFDTIFPHETQLKEYKLNDEKSSVRSSSSQDDILSIPRFGRKKIAWF